MPVFTIKNYKITDMLDKSLFTTNFSSPIKLKQDVFSILQNDLIFVSNLNLNFSVKTYLTLGINLENSETEIQIAKNYKEKSFKITQNNQALDTDLFSFLEQKLGIKFKEKKLITKIFDISHEIFKSREDVVKFLNNCKPNVVAQAFNSDTKNIDDLLSSVTEDKKDKLKNDAESLIDIEDRQMKIEKGVDLYQNGKKIIETKNKEKQALQNELDAIRQKFVSVEHFEKRRIELEHSISKFSSSGSSEKVASLKKERLNKIIGFLKNIKSRDVSLVPKFEWEDEIDKSFRSINVQIVVFGILFIIQILFGILTLILSRDVQSWFFSVAIFLTLVILLVIYNLLGSKTSPRSLLNFEIDSQAKIPQVAFLSQEDKIFVNNAYFNAYRSELETINQSIQMALGAEGTFTDLKAMMQNVEGKIIELENEISKINRDMYTTDEYYKKRRELDILKIEKENIEFSWSKEEQPRLTELKSAFKEASLVQNLSEQGTRAWEGYPVVITGWLRLTEASLQILNNSISELKEGAQILQIDVAV